jgi:hypothetical protein
VKGIICNTTSRKKEYMNTKTKHDSINTKPNQIANDLEAGYHHRRKKSVWKNAITIESMASIPCPKRRLLPPSIL